MRVALILDTTDSPNWGCRATTLALHREMVLAGAAVPSSLLVSDIDVGPAVRGLARAANGVLSVIKPQAPSSQLFARSQAGGGGSGRFARAQHHLERVDQRLLPAPTDASALEPAAKRLWNSASFRAHRQAIEAADAVVINGEGAIYGRQRKGRLALTIAFAAKVYADRPVALVNQTVELSDPGMRSLAEQVLPMMDDVSFREPWSVRECEGLVSDDRNRLVPDAAFSYRAATDEAWWAWASRPEVMSVWPDRLPMVDPEYVCVGGSSAFLRADSTAIDPTAPLRHIIRSLMKHAPVIVTASDPVDELILRPLAAELGCGFVGTAMPVQQAIDLVANARVYVTGRWHPSILASLGGTPVVGMSGNSFKVQAFQELIESGQPTFLASELGPRGEDIVESALAAIAAGDELRSTIRARADQLRHQVPGLTRMLQTL